ncbi:hypothetical protein M441DRAFT_441917 [Trichoderma asperellum CBS 433.97]|uniref:Uncharacterized protein n=1 Tax=Trichoderma asperellum (strain ATCC 204424 / CBS 433.97 / NBRC 101777) TaxID=1042311 RepID=A0A2T3Z4E3_TRIA4|nr:hypothetical protein M441DRAFT_441917 [Trichoderma asperellum CBS 433.97]PTB39657.1 hypothetical protein M441DRAFT_441917 [Trichoderma asperellum CBS 433.97]
MHNQALRLSLACRATGAFTRRWFRTRARTTSHEPRTVSVRRLVLAIRLAALSAYPTTNTHSRVVLHGTTHTRLIPASTATQQPSWASEALLGEIRIHKQPTEAWDGGTHQQPRSDDGPLPGPRMLTSPAESAPRLVPKSG